MDDGRWSNQSYNKNEMRRIYYIKEKKDNQRQQQNESDNRLMTVDEENEPKSKNKKRELKSDKQKNQPVVDESEQSLEKGKNFYKNKKK